MSEYQSAIDLAARLIIKKGREAIFQHFVAGEVANPDKPWEKTPRPPVEQTLKMVFLDYEQKDIDGTKIKSGDKQVLMFAKGVLNDPVANADKIKELPKHGGATWAIVKSEPLKPGDETVMYTLQVRR